MYSREIRIEFNHCDPAGIVFFPRYFEILNSQVENFFRDALECPFEKLILIERFGVPTVHFEIDFLAPSRLGELVTFRLDVQAIGRASVDFHHRATGPDGITRLTATQRIVWVTPEGRSAPWPGSLRARLTAHRPAD